MSGPEDLVTAGCDQCFICGNYVLTLLQGFDDDFKSGGFTPD